MRCGTPYDYRAIYVGHLGDYRCPNCGHARPALDVAARSIELHGLERAAFDLVTPAGTQRVELGLPGLYNVYNAVGAAALAQALGASLDEIAEGLARFSAAFGRFERIPVDGKQLLLLLIKNPAGANEVVRTLVDGGPPRVAVVALNDAIADGRDVSWIWDVDFEPLLAGTRDGRRHRRARRRARAPLQVRRVRRVAHRRRAVARSGDRPRPLADARRRRARRAPDVHGDARAAAARRPTAAWPSATGSARHDDDPRRPSLSRVPQHLRRPRQHRRLRAARSLARPRARRDAARHERPDHAGRTRPLLHRRRAGPRAVPRRGESGGEVGAVDRSGRRRRRRAPCRLRRLPAARPRVPRLSRRGHAGRRAPAARDRRRRHGG